MIAAELQHFPVEAAYLCSDCNAVGNNAMRCPACAGESLLSISNVLNRIEAANDEAGH